MISLHFNFPILISLDYDFPIHKYNQLAIFAVKDCYEVKEAGLSLPETYDLQIDPNTTPSPRVKRFHVVRNSTSTEFLKTALCGIPLQWNSSKLRYAEFQWNSKYSPTNAIFA